MLKTRVHVFSHRDVKTPITLTELPALVADRAARRVLAALDEDPDGGVLDLACRHLSSIRRKGALALDLLSPFTSGLDLDTLPSWRQVLPVMELSVLLHADFLLGREAVQIPVALQVSSRLQGTRDSAPFCSPLIAQVLHARLASYVELETVLSTEDVFNLAELINIEHINEWQRRRRSTNGS